MSNDLLRSYLDVVGLSKPPRNLSLFHSFSLLELLTSAFHQEVTEDLREVMNLRNFSYLEHGYNVVNKESGGTAIAKAENVLSAILAKAGLNASLAGYATELRHQC